MAPDWGQSEIENQSWWKRRSALERGLTILAVFGIVMSIGLAIGLGVEASKCKSKDKFSNVTERPTQKTMDKICLKDECIHTASRVLNTIDKNVDPCNNFYQFACGSFINSTTIPDEDSVVTTFKVIQDDLLSHVRSSLEEKSDPAEPHSFTLAKNFYQSCLNKNKIEEVGLKPLQNILQEIGGWPVVEGDKWNEISFKWEDTVYKLRKLGLIDGSIITSWVEPDDKDNKKPVIRIHQASFELSREFLIKGLEEKSVVAYYEYMVDVAGIFGVSETKAKDELRASLDFEIKLAKISLPDEEMRNITKLYNRMTIEELQKNNSFISWIDYINKLLPEGVSKLDSGKEIMVSSPKYLEDLGKLLESTPKRVQANYVIWRTVFELVSYLHDEIRAPQLKYLMIKSGITQRQPRWKECVKEVSKRLSISVGALYVRKYFQKNAKDDAVAMVQDIRDTFIDKILNKTEWMDEKTKKSAIEKVMEMGSYIAYPDELLNDTIINEYYENLQIDENAYIQNYLNVQKFNAKKNWEKLDKPLDKTMWYKHSKSAVVNAFYAPSENSIQIPAGILQGSFFHKDRPRYMNYGAIGFVVGHEITHGFDDQGSQYNKDGNLFDWWSPSSKEKYLEKAQCIVDQYSNYTVEEVGGEHINGKNTQGENIADNGGLKVAYIAYNDWVNRSGMELKLPGLNYSPNQMFWISVAHNWCAKFRPEALKNQIANDEHTPSEFRVLGPLSNMPEFAKDFNCPSGSNMNPEHKCSVW